MTTILLIVGALFWLIRIGLNIISYVTLWYVKEYRPDRMMIHLKKTTQGKWIYFPKWKLPPLSTKTATLTVTLFLTEFLLFIFLPYQLFVKLFVMDLTLFPLSFLFVVLLRIPTKLFHTYTITKARNVLSKHSWKSVIGITGSYGKTSTKDFVSTILSGAYSVLKTEASKNSSIGISETVLATLRDTHQMFVVEMGAYGVGEIKEMTELVRPNIGIITAINAQHQDLFGSIETTMKAKYELLQGLVGDKIAIVNEDIAETYLMGQWAMKEGVHVWFVTKNKKLHADAAFWIDEVSSDTDSVTFLFHYKKEKEKIIVSISGEHFVMNIALAIAAAVASGLSFHDACTYARRISALGTVMRLQIGTKGETLINDTFNNNPEAAIAGLEHLAKFPKKKVLVFQPMIELGAFTNVSHERVGKVAGRICDEIVLTNANFSKPFIKGVHEVNPHIQVQIASAEKASQYIQHTVSAGDAVLFKGKEAEFVWKHMVVKK